jgi:predicted AlkP superfamily phosphohydrolase/phosphomutase
MSGRRAFVFGLDCACPELWFSRWREELPVVSALCERATYGPLHSVHPPITIPAWAAMLTGCDPGQLGLYGFRGRRSREARTATLYDATDLGAPTLWDLLGREGGESIVVGFPPSYPPRPLRGHMVSGMLTPPDASEWTFPASLRSDVAAWVGPDRRYAFDAEAHRDGDLERLRDEVFEMTRTRFDVVRQLVRSRPWDFAFVHEIGLDRLQHAYWDSLSAPESAGAGILRDYHRLLDAEVGETLGILPEDTVVCIASDHGARSFEGSFCLNEWLRQEGYLMLREPAPPTDSPQRLDPDGVDWERTRAWADGGYCGRIYLNVDGREPEGPLPPADARRTRDELREKLEGLRGPDGQRLGTAAYFPEEVYSQVSAVAPDLLVYPGDLAFRCSERLGDESLFLCENDTGPDAANHSWEGLFVLSDPAREGRGHHAGAHLLDIAPTLLERLSLPVPGWMRGGTIPCP